MREVPEFSSDARCLDTRVMRRQALPGAGAPDGAAEGRASLSRVAARGRSVAPGLWALAALALAACGSEAKPKRVAAVTPGLQRGMATWYGGELHGGPTASGERFDKRKLTAAHRTLRFGSRVRVTNTRNGRSVEVRINDRGPFGGRNRIIDVSEAAARQLGMIEAGVVPVTVEVLP
jgi:rare lipoprotein A